MQTIQVTLNDSLLEQAVLRLAKEQHQNLQEFVMAAFFTRICEKVIFGADKKIWVRNRLSAAE